LEDLSSLRARAYGYSPDHDDSGGWSLKALYKRAPAALERNDQNGLVQATRGMNVLRKPDSNYTCGSTTADEEEVLVHRWVVGRVAPTRLMCRGATAPKLRCGDVSGSSGSTLAPMSTAVSPPAFFDTHPRRCGHRLGPEP
jgi:hypothetical protein